ncbi:MULTISPECIES: DHA2 family efflux MFS transporter permease subunit [Streptomyces]|uniref:DHA2 family efflux MFS transporter permease subunit n=1 Tax=Streptomyces sudanensis TaxID=436397 RepID=A0ABY4TIQ6_9ACTN|nr:MULTISPECIES: DHA2 family efflux MFS transporter permease subunit [Streptomyces]URN17521.1 DHA2 family efflux MFS transporter permease subunit [Streptomyces sudanensis]
MSLPDEQTTATPDPPAPRPRLGLVFTVIAAGVAMSNLDVFIVNVALPGIGEDFGGSSLASLSWVLNAYAVVFAALLVPAGNFADRTSPRTAYLAGLVTFTAASALCALATGVWFLVAARVVQAVGAALLIPSSLGLLLATTPPERRVSSVRAWTAISGVASALGPVAGGLLTELDWRWVFLVNVPVGIAALVAGVRVLPRVPARDLPRPDLLGAGLLTVAVAALALGLVKGEEWGWGSPAFLGSLALTVVLLVWFVARSARHRSPVLPLPLLRIPAFSPASLANVLFAVAFAAMLLSAVLWCQDVWHWSPLKTGLAIFPGTLLPPVLAVTIGPLARRVGAGPIAVAGCVVFAAGIAWWYAWMTPGADYLTGMLPGMLLTGVGVGLTLPTLVTAAVTALPPQSFSTGSGVVTMARQVGTVLGIALLVAAMGTPKGTAEVLAAFDDGWLMTMVATGAAAVVSLLVGMAGRVPGGAAERP